MKKKKKLVGFYGNERMVLNDYSEGAQGIIGGTATFGNGKTKIIEIEKWKQYEYMDSPLYFSPITIDDAQKLRLIQLFEESYGNTDQDTTDWSLEFEVVVRNILNGFLIFNPKYLIIEEIYNEIEIIINPSKEKELFGVVIDMYYLRDAQVFCPDAEIPDPESCEACNMYMDDGNWKDIRKDQWLGYYEWISDDQDNLKKYVAKKHGLKSETLSVFEIKRGV